MTGNDIWWETEKDRAMWAARLTAYNQYEQSFPVNDRPTFITAYAREEKKRLLAYRQQLRLWLDKHPDRAVLESCEDPRDSDSDGDPGYGASPSDVYRAPEVLAHLKKVRLNEYRQAVAHSTGQCGDGCVLCEWEDHTGHPCEEHHKQEKPTSATDSVAMDC
jgi:hypothetical protein